MIRSLTVSAAVSAVLVAGCGGQSTGAAVKESSSHPSPHHPSSGPGQAGAEWAIPEASDQVVAAMNQMPTRLGAWDRVQADRGMVFYEHPDGQLGIEGADLADVFVDDVTPATAVERLKVDFDPDTVRSCSRPPYRCLLGASQGQPAMVWSHDRSEAILVAVWPDEESRDLLARAWTTAQN
jgi:hypothetical protein